MKIWLNVASTFTSPLDFSILEKKKNQRNKAGRLFGPFSLPLTTQLRCIFPSSVVQASLSHDGEMGRNLKAPLAFSDDGKEKKFKPVTCKLLARASYINCGTQCKIKIWSPLLKKQEKKYL